MVRLPAWLTFLAGFISSMAAAASPPASVSGHWIAALAFGPTRVRLALHITVDPKGPISATADSIEQSAFGLRVTNLVLRERELSFAIPKLGGRFAGALSEDGKTIRGQWKQRQGVLPLTFERGNIRPQEPAPPYPYEARDVIFHDGSVRLAGTLTLPRSPGPHPAIALLSGSGPQDRDGASSGHRPLLVWADFLTRRGFATLRMDDRGVGRSSGRLLDSTDEDFASDALSAVSFLQSRSEVDPRRIGLLGHSEGGAVASIAAARSRDVAFLVLLAAPAISGEQILFAQNERISRALGIPDDVARKSREIENRLFDIARQEKGPAARAKMEAALDRETAGLPPETAATVRGQVGGQIAVAASSWFRFLLDFDPRPALRSVECPVLALYGGLDLQVPAELNAPAMTDALAAHAEGSVFVVTGLNHMFQIAGTGSPLEYSRIEETVSPAALEMVGDWLDKLPVRSSNH